MGETSSDFSRDVRGALATRFSEETLKQWFDPLRLKKNLRDKELSVIWPHRLFFAWINVEYIQALEEAIRQADNSVRITYAYGPTQLIESSRATQVKDVPEKTPSADKEFPYGSTFTLDSYLSNNKNVFPMTVLHETVEGLLRWNPLVLYGSTGTGKSHLIRAVGNALAAKYGREAIFCGTVDGFATMQTSLTNRELFVKMGKWHAVILDDIQRAAALPKMRDILPLVLDHCCETNKPFVCASGLPPSQWHVLPPPLAARLEQGLVMLLHEADMDIRLRFAQHHCKAKRLTLSRDQLLALAQQCTGIRRLIGVIQRLSALRDLLGHDVSAHDIESVLAHTADNVAVTPQAIIKVVAAKCGVKAEDIVSGKRQPKVARARQIAMFLCRSLLSSSYPALGRLFGGRDHSTVIHSVKKIQVLWESDTAVHNLINELSVSCRQQHK